MENAEAEKVKLSSSLHLPCNPFEPIDLALDLTLAPRPGTGSIHGRVILLHTPRETFELSAMTAFGCSDPILQFMRSAFFENTQEVLTELIRCAESLTRLTYLIELLLLMSSELLFGKYKEEGSLLRRKPLTFGCRHDCRT